MTLQRWLVGAGWVCLCGLGAIGVLAALTAVAVGAVLAPFALIGFLIGPSSNLDLGRFVPAIALWVSATALSALLCLWSFTRCLAVYAAPRAPLPAWTPGAKWSSIATGLLASLCIGQASLAPFFTPSAEQAARAEPLPTTDEDKAAYVRDWLPKAQAGEPYAQFVVSQALQEGLMGQHVDPSAALGWLKKAAAQGDPDATLSLLVAQRLGGLGFTQHFDIEAPLIGFAATQSRWRRAAVQLILATNPPVVVGGGASNHVEVDKRSNFWLEKAALGGSRYAAFQLARALERARDEANNPTPDWAGAMHWYAFAGAEFEVERLQAQAKLPAPVAASPAHNDDAPSAEELSRLKRRAEIVALRNRGNSVSMASDDALAHFIIHAEAGQHYTLLGDAALQRTPLTRLSGDTQLALMYYLLAARRGDEAAAAKLRELGVTLR